MLMKFIVYGGDARSHAIVSALCNSRLVQEVICYPNNGGLWFENQKVRCLGPLTMDGAPNIYHSLGEIARHEKVDAVIFSAEKPLSEGAVDIITGLGVPCFGPTVAAAMLESDKWFAKKIMTRLGIQTASATVHKDASSARKHIGQFGYPVVIKAIGLAAGKGVKVCRDKAEAESWINELQVKRIFGAAGDTVMIEQYISGREFSVFAIVDVRGNIFMCIPAVDYKKLSKRDPSNTGGMGSYAPVPWISKEMMEYIEAKIFRPIVDEMIRRGTPYSGVLYAGLMLTRSGPLVLEFNCRFGDPEFEPLSLLFDNDFASIVKLVASGSIYGVKPKWKKKCSVCVVVARSGYPHEKTPPLRIPKRLLVPHISGVKVFHAGTHIDMDGSMSSTGGRVLAVTATGRTFRDAREKAYRHIGRLPKGFICRKDIAAEVL